MSVTIPSGGSFIEPQGEFTLIRQGKNSLDEVDQALRSKMNRVKSDSSAYDKLDLLKTNLQLLREKFPEIEKESGCAQFAHKLKIIVDSIDLHDLSNLDEQVQGFSETFKEYNTERTATAIAKIASGKVKDVFSEPVTHHVLYTARPGKGPFARIIRALHEVELRKEVGSVKDIIKNLAGKKDIGKNLALEYEESSHKINGKYTIQTKEAKTDFEKQIRKVLPFPQSALNGLNFLRGVRDLQDAGFVQGDMKPSNCLVFGEDDTPQVKLSDFGKARMMSREQRGTHTGNCRFSPPEGFLSQRGEVFSAALVIIRSLEEEVLQSEKNNMMLSIVKYKDQSAQSEERRGIEKFLVQNAECIQTESSHMRGKFRVLLQRGEAMIASVPQEKIDKTTEQVHKYIGVLINSLKQKHPENKDQLEQLGILLKKMTVANPAERPEAEYAVKEMERIMSQIRNH